MWIHKDGRYSFNAVLQAKTNTYDADNNLAYQAYNTQFDEVNKLDLGESTTLTFTYTIDDGNGGTDTGDITVTINGANDTPIANNDNNSVSEEGTISKSFLK